MAVLTAEEAQKLIENRIRDRKMLDDQLRIVVSGQVSRNDNAPVVNVEINCNVYELTMGQARKIAGDILLACGYAEADAKIISLHDNGEHPEGILAALMHEYRECRAKAENLRR